MLIITDFFPFYKSFGQTDSISLPGEKSNIVAARLRLVCYDLIYQIYKGQKKSPPLLQ
jgi:hypothetical protein